LAFSRTSYWWCSLANFLGLFHYSSNWGELCGLALMVFLIVVILLLDRYEKQVIAFCVLVIDRVTNLLPPKGDDYDHY
jgi:hypothetical protein